MTKQITPMKRLSGNLKEIERLFDNHYTRLHLNRKEADSNSVYESYDNEQSGSVNFDALFIYNPLKRLRTTGYNDRYKLNSFGIAFNYENGKEEIFFNIKKDGNLNYSSPVSVEQAKVLLKNFKTALIQHRQENKTIDDNTIFNLFKEIVFLKEENNLDHKEIRKKSLNEAAEKLKKIQEKETEVSQLSEKASSIVSRTKEEAMDTALGKLLTSLREERQELFKKLKDLDSEISRVTDDLNTTIRKKQSSEGYDDVIRGKNRATSDAIMLKKDFDSFCAIYKINPADIPDNRHGGTSIEQKRKFKK